MTYITSRRSGFRHRTASLSRIFKMEQPSARTYVAAFALAFTATIAPQVSQAQFEPQLAQFDRPLATTRQAVKSDLVDTGGGLICYAYDQFMVKRLDSGTPAGDVSMAVVPTAGRLNRDRCTIETVPGEVSIKVDGYSFTGVRGNFLFVSATDPNGAVPFKVYDRRTANLRYADSTDDHGLQFTADEGDTLHIRFRRGVNGTCSIPRDGEACWAKITRDANFVHSVARLPAPVGSCTAVYKRQKVALDDPSIIVYDVDLVVTPHGSPNVLSRGEISCEPLP